MRETFPTIGTLDVVSVAGMHTRVALPDLGCVFDLGLCDEVALRARHVFLTHTHMDHMSGVWQHATLQQFAAQRSGIYHLPNGFFHLLERFLDAAELLDCSESPLRRQPHGMGHGASVSLRDDLRVVAFRTDHRIPSLGYAVVRMVRKLKAEYRGMQGKELAWLRQKGVGLYEYIETVEFAYTGDTRIEVLAQPLVRAAKVLVMECTYLGSEVTVEQARRNGHIHLDEIAGNVSALDKVERVVLMHFSKRHKAQQIIAEAQKALPSHLYDRTRLVVEQHMDRAEVST